MFKKKPTIKTLSPLRSSDRRKIADRIISDYGLESAKPLSGDADANNEEQKAVATAAHTALRNSLLPDNSLSAKFTTTSGPDLKGVNGTVYIGSHGKGEQRVLWVMLDDRLYPTVYTLWNNPGILPLLHTPSIVVQKLKGGADLMTPGLAGPPFPRKAKKGAVVAVASLDAPTVPVVVGTCAVDVSALEQVQGTKGQAVQTMHWEGDELWDWSTSGKAGSAAPESLEGWDLVDSDEGLSNDMQGASLDEDDGGGVALHDPDPPPDVAKDRNEFVEGEDIAAATESHTDEAEITTAYIDDAFRKAFLYGVYTYKQNHPNEPKFGLTFPLSQSFVMSDLVLPFLPIFTPKQAESLTIKKSSFKNIRKFIKALDKQNLVLSKEHGGKASNNEVTVWDIDFEDRAFQDFVPYELPKKGTNDAQPTNGGKAASTATSSDDPSVGQKLRRIELYRPKDSISTLFPSGPKSLYTAAEVRSAITTYIDNEQLASSTNKRLVTLNPTLSNAVLSTSSTLDTELLSKGSIPRDALVSRVLDMCAPYHAIVRESDPAEPKSKAKAGAAPKIEIILETRSGNKTVTRVHGLEVYFVQGQQLADELRRACASSTSVEQFKGGLKGVMEVMVQGPQKDAVLKALERRGVAKQYVDVTDKTKKKK